MNILIFEDREMISQQMTFILEKQGHKVTRCTNCTAVESEVSQDSFDLYIIDLNTAALGLCEEQVRRTQNGLRTGWILLCDIIYEIDNNCFNKTIVFSDYIGTFKGYIDSDTSSYEEKKWFSVIKNNGGLIEKQEGYKALRNAVKSFTSKYFDN